MLVLLKDQFEEILLWPTNHRQIIHSKLSSLSLARTILLVVVGGSWHAKEKPLRRGKSLHLYFKIIENAGSASIYKLLKLNLYAFSKIGPEMDFSRSWRGDKYYKSGTIGKKGDR